MKTLREIRREIKIVRACFAAGMERTAKAFGTKDCVVAGEGALCVPLDNSDQTKWIHDVWTRFLYRYGDTKVKETDKHGNRVLDPKGNPRPQPLSAADLKGYVESHEDFIMDPHVVPADTVEYVKSCQGGATKPQPALTKGR